MIVGTKSVNKNFPFFYDQIAWFKLKFVLQPVSNEMEEIGLAHCLEI